MAMTTKPFLTGGSPVFPFYGNPTPTVPTPNPVNMGWGQGWGMYNPFSNRQTQPGINPQILKMWQDAMASNDASTLMTMSSDGNIRNALARALGVNVNQLANMSMMTIGKSTTGAGVGSSKWTPEMSRNYYMSGRNGGTPTTTGTGTGGMPQLTSPYANMTMLFRDNTGMLHDPGDNPIWEQLSNLPTTTPQVPTTPMSNQWKPNFGWGHRGNNNTTVPPPSNVPVYRNPVQPGTRTVTQPNAGTTTPPPSTTMEPPPPPITAPDPRLINDPGRSWMQQ